MWLLALTFVAATLLLSWMMAGYLVWLRLAGGPRRPAPERASDERPVLSVVIPCFNEADLIEDKLANVLSCRYPADRVEIVFADGGSSDGTVERLERALPGDRQVRLVRCPRPGKINQINHVLPGLRGSIVVNSDVDARLDAGALLSIADEFADRPAAAVVGACCSPLNGMRIEQCYWTAQNRCRVMESNVAFASVVIAGCYAFRRDLLSRFPEDVVADDAYVAALANSLGYETVYSQRATARELRAPQTLFDFLTHKFRKSNAVLRETLRFAYRMPDLSPRWRLILLTRLGQLLCMPWVAAVWTLAAAALAIGQQYDLVGFGTLWLGLWVVAARAALTHVDLPEGHDGNFGWWTTIQGYVCTMAVVLAAGMSYPFFRQGSCYARLGQATRQGAGQADGDSGHASDLPADSTRRRERRLPAERSPALAPPPPFGAQPA